MIDNPDQNDRTQTHVVLSKDTLVGHYRIIEKIGAGGMGEVYLAQDTELDRKVALKFLPHHMCADEDLRARFKREAQAAAKLSHPNIVTIYEVNEYNGRPFFAMEHIKGRPLKELIKTDDLSLESAVDIVLQLCEGLGKAHREGIIHRDIKPSNIIVDDDGRARLLDFGLAAIQQGEKLTKTGSTLGTIGYMSPEQVKAQPTDQRSDLFSLGVVLYEMITGHRPFEKDNEAATLKAILGDIPEPLARYKSGVPEELQRIVTKLLEKDPAFRYQNAEGVCPDLKRLGAGKSTVPGKPVDWWNRYVVVGAAIVLIVMAVLWMTGQLKIFSEAEIPGAQKKMLAVLPFTNLGLPEDEYFADGITDEITSRLAMVRGLGVISRTSAYAYKNSEKTLPQIAKELGVDYILEGTIRWDKTSDVERVRITPQLIRVSDDVHMWAGNFEKTKTGIFDIQIDIATRIVDTLGVTLLTSERQSMEYRPTDDFDAYDLYLRGKEYWDKRDYKLAIPLLEKSVAADSGFAQAYSLLARIHGFLYFNMLDRTESRLRQCEEAASKAVRSSDGGIEGYIGRGYFYYYCRNDYGRALEEFEKVLDLQPNNSDVLAAVGFVQRRQGKWREAVNNMAAALKINPHSRMLVSELAFTLEFMREYDMLNDILDRSLTLSPDATELLFYKATVLLLTGHDTSEVHEVVDQAVRYGEPDMVAYWMESSDILFRNYESAVKRRKVPGEYILANRAEFYLSKGDIYRYWGRDSLSRIYYDSARMMSEETIVSEPESPFAHSHLGYAYAALGRSSDAIREGKKSTELLPISKDALYGAGMLEYLANVYVMTGSYDMAVDLLDSLMSIPSGINLYDLQHHPMWDPLRNHPRFRALIEQYGKS